MILNTFEIINQLKSEKTTLIENPLIQKEKELKRLEEEKEQKLQDQVKVLFQDREFYKLYQESALPVGIKPVISEEEKERKKKEDAEEEADRIRNKQLTHAVKGAVLTTAAVEGTKALLGKIIRG